MSLEGGMANSSYERRLQEADELIQNGKHRNAVESAGGGIELLMRALFDKLKDKLSPIDRAELQGHYNTYANKTKPKGKLTFGEWIGFYDKEYLLPKLEKEFGYEFKYINIDVLYKIMEVRNDCVHEDYQPTSAESGLVHSCLALFIEETNRAPQYERDEQKPTKTPVPSNDTLQSSTNNPNGRRSQAGDAIAKQLEKKKEKIDRRNGATQPDKEKKEPMSHDDPKQTPHTDDAIQQLLRQHQEMMRHMQRQQASHQKTTASASADVIQLLFRQNQEMMQHMQQMQASQPAATANADVIQLLIPLIHQNQALMQQASQSPASTSDDAVQQLVRQNQAFMQQMQTSQPVININPNISPNINPSISANAGDQVTYAPSAQTTDIAERNNAAFVVGVLGGLFGLLGIAHIFNHKVLRGLVYLFIGTVCYWIFLLFLLATLIDIGSSLWIAAVAIHLVIIWQHAKRGAGSASANQTKEPKRK